MVESKQIDNIFMALADATRRSILEHVAIAEMSIGEIAAHYSLSFAAVSKHIKVLERAKLVTKKRRGKEQLVIIVPDTFALGQEQIGKYARLWHERFDKLDQLLKEL